MKLKEIIKCVLGFVRCIKSGINYRSGVYVGGRVHFENGKNIKLGKNVQIRPDVDIFAGEVCEIGDRCDIGTRTRLTGNIVFEDAVLLGPDNYISSVDHTYQDVSLPIMDQGAHAININGHNEIKVGYGSWIGTHVAIIGDVHIGKHCVIAANSVVTKDVPDYCVVGGIPAKIIKRYNMDTKIWEKVIY